MRHGRAVEARVLAGFSAACFIIGAALIAWPVARTLLTGYATAEAQDRALASWERGARDRPGNSLVLEIPRLGVRRYVPDGATVENLRRYGVGHISWTSFPPAEGALAAPPREVVGIAGHRTTYGAPFFRIGQLRPGDTVVLVYNHRRYAYSVDRQVTVRPSDAEVLESNVTQLALITCSPPYSAALRLIVFAHLTGIGAEPASHGARFSGGGPHS